MNLNNFSLNFLMLNNFIKIFKYLKTDIVDLFLNISDKPIKTNDKHPYNLKYFVNSVWFSLIIFFYNKKNQDLIEILDNLQDLWVQYY